jgi:hypothetical protein
MTNLVKKGCVKAYQKLKHGSVVLPDGVESHGLLPFLLVERKHLASGKVK